MRNISCLNMVDTLLDDNIPICVGNETNIVNLSNEPLGVPDNCTVAVSIPSVYPLKPFKRVKRKSQIFFNFRLSFNRPFSGFL